MSLESGDMAYLLQLNEYLDVQEFIQDVDTRDRESKQRAEEAARRAASRGRRGR